MTERLSISLHFAISQVGDDAQLGCAVAFSHHTEYVELTPPMIRHLLALELVHGMDLDPRHHDRRWRESPPGVDRLTPSDYSRPNHRNRA